VISPVIEKPSFLRGSSIAGMECKEEREHRREESGGEERD
jgi:hypothetical protein